MNALPVVIAAGVVVALVRLGRRRRSRSGRFPKGVLPAWLRGRKLLGDTGLVAGREIRERMRGRVFRVVTVILFAAVAAAIVIPTIHTTTTKSQTVGVVAGSASLDAELRGLADNVGLSVTVVNEADLSHARAALSAGRLAVVVDGTEKILVKDPISESDSSAAVRFVRAVSATLGARRAFAQAGLTPQQAATVGRAEPLAVESIRPGKKVRTTAEATALLGVILVFIVLNQYLTWTLMGVMEEKASRVVEVLLATVRPIQLLAGKVIGIGAVALAQAVALVAFALVLAAAVGSSLVHGAAPLVVAATLAWLVLGYSFYSWLYAAAGSLAERQDQVQSLALPLERAPHLRLHRLAHRGELGQCFSAAEGARLPAAHGSLRHADVDRIRRCDLVAVPALGRHHARLHGRRGARRGPGVPDRRAADRSTGTAARARADDERGSPLPAQ